VGIGYRLACLFILSCAGAERFGAMVELELAADFGENNNNLVSDTLCFLGNERIGRIRLLQQLTEPFNSR
jgi:hypothetical protein